MTLPNRIFFTGVPGSRWSGIAAWIEDNVPGMNTSDRSDQRFFQHPPPTNDRALPANHNGTYFGTGMEYPASLYADVLDLPWHDKDISGCRILKSHEWSLMLDDIEAKFPHDWIMLVYRPDLPSLDWWLEIGGFNIEYPDYSHYCDRDGMLKAIQEQNSALLKFANKHKAVWSHLNPKWMNDTFGVEVDGLNEMYYDILVTVIKSPAKINPTY